MKKFYTLLAAAATTVAAMAWDAPNPMPTTMYLIGDPCDATKAEVPANAILGDPTTGWSPLNGIPMEAVEGQEGVFEVNIKILDQVWFAFNPVLLETANWDVWNASRYTPAASGAAEVGAQPMAIAGNPDSWNIPAGDYKFIVNAATGIFTVEGNLVREIGDVYLRGSFNGWLNEGTDAKYLFTKVSETLYTLDVEEIGAYSVEGEGEAAVELNAFKIGNRSWGSKWTSGDNQMAISTPYFYDETSDANMGLAEAAKNVTITLDLEEETITIAPQSAGINGVEVAEDGEAVYYNLQGVRVANPEKGLFIQVKGGKAGKVIL